LTVKFLGQQIHVRWKNFDITARRKNLPAARRQHTQEDAGD